MRFVHLAVVGVLAAVLVAGCGDEHRGGARAVSRAEFDDVVRARCARYAKAADEALAPFQEAFVDRSRDASSVDRTLEASRRGLVRASRALIADLRDVRPAARAGEWAAALDGYEAAIDRAAAGARVDVNARGLATARDRLVDGFGLGACFGT